MPTKMSCQGWLDLQRVWFDNRNDPTMLKAGIKDWQTRYPNNPGATLLPTQLVNVQNFKPASTSKIALLLPLGGQAAVFGRTIQQGFDAARNGTAAVTGNAVPAQVAQAANAGDVVSPSSAETNDLTTAQPVAVQEGTMQNPVQALRPENLSPHRITPCRIRPRPLKTTEPVAAPNDSVQAPMQAPVTEQAPQTTAIANPAAEVKVYDTSTQPLDQVLNQVQQDGASIVVGPLLKNNVEELMKSRTPLNVLALNQPEQVQNLPNVCYFACRQKTKPAMPRAISMSKGSRRLCC
ncbi:Lipoprotein activator of PBP from the outer membrane A [Leclercia adecarboxylata]|uniref:Lipoprotein activator of PBP from the outer membrane A n=1 Tax=Leclercia adecarboxylata TaxID=83655 RepID=A0A4U9ITG3_9ENTR|nr:Lipoprotein activator of PBP from the outer membrane A [Leclercia adecarboxylata]